MSSLRFVQQCGDPLAGQFATDEVARLVVLREFTDCGPQTGRQDAIPVQFIAQRMDALVAVCVR
jgi:hypothetical protein